VAYKETGWLGTKAVAEFFDVTTMTVNRWVSNPDLDFPKPRVVQNRNYFSREECDSWMKKRDGIKTVKTVKVQ
jgi:hypothetical protein